MPDPTPQEQERARAACKHLASAGPIGARKVHPHQCSQCDSIAEALAEQREHDANIADSVCTCLGPGGQSQAGAAIREQA